MQTKNKRQIFVALIAVLTSVFLVALVVYAATTVGNDVSIGGDLTVTGDATTTGNQVISGSLIVTGTSSPAGSKIEMGTRDHISGGRGQIWNSLFQSVLRLGALTSDGDAFNTSSEGIVVYGENVDGDSMDPNNWGYARVKPDRFGLYNNKDGVTNWLFRLDLSTNDFYLKDNSGTTTFDFNRATGELYISGNVGIGTTTPSSLLHISKDSATTTITIGNESGGGLACLKLRDSDDGGWSYCTILDGTMNCTTTSCE